MARLSEEKPLRISWKKVVAFRLSRHHLSKRTPAAGIISAAADMAGAQAQVLSAGEMSIWARVKGVTAESIEAALWRKRTLVRGWAMRRTMFLLPSDQLAIFARGTSRRSEYNLAWAYTRAASRQQLDRLLDDTLEIRDMPRTRSKLAEGLKARGYRLKSKAGGGWGDSRAVPHVELDGISPSVGFILHLVDARGVICSGPNERNESTYVRAERWVPNWKDTTPEQAEPKLLDKYLGAFGPATLADFALWTGMYVSDAKAIWSRAADRIAHVDVEGWKAVVLGSDLPKLQEAEPDGPEVRLLPFFDSFVLGHRSHRNIVDEKNHKKVYRAQGWVSPVLLVDGRARGVWSHVQGKSGLEVHVTPFTRLPSKVSSQIREVARDLGRFLGSPEVKTTIA